MGEMIERDGVEEVLRDMQEYRDLSERVRAMFGDTITLKEIVDSLEREVREPEKPDPVRARILSYEESDMWDAYIAIGTPEQCQEAVEKQTPMKVKEERWIYTECKCGRVFSEHYGDGYYSIPEKNKTKYCPDCGQRLEWEKEGDNR